MHQEMHLLGLCSCRYDVGLDFWPLSSVLLITLNAFIHNGGMKLSGVSNTIF